MSVLFVALPYSDSSGQSYKHSMIINYYASVDDWITYINHNEGLIVGTAFDIKLATVVH